MTFPESGVHGTRGVGIASAKALFLLALSCLVAPVADSHAQGDSFPIELLQGVIVGEVTQTSAILQSRLTSSQSRVDRRWSGMPGSPGVARFEISTSPDFRNRSETEWFMAIPENDYIVKTSLRGLTPGTRYHYRLVYGPDRTSLRVSPSGTFRTHSGSEAAYPVRFAIVTGMNYSRFHYLGGPFAPPYTGPDKELGYPALESIRKLQPDFFVGTGDNVYYDIPATGRAETQQQLRMKHHEQYSQSRFIQLFREVATYWMKDDHDHRYDDSDPYNPYLGPGGEPKDYSGKEKINPRLSGAGFQPSHEVGIRVFREQLPVVDPDDDAAVTYRTYRVNKLLQVWFVEGRDYRSENDMVDGPEKSLWGTEQRDWLKRTLLESDATFKILFSPTPMVGPDSTDKRDNHVNPQGFRHEGEEFFRWLQQEGFLTKNFYIVCGDRHWQYHSIHPSGFEEFSVGALVDQNAALGEFPGDPNSSDPEGRIRQPYHYEEPTGGFLLLTVRPGSEQSSAEAEFAFYDDHGGMLYKHVMQANVGR